MLGSWHTLRVSKLPKSHFLLVQDGRKTFHISPRSDNHPPTAAPKSQPFRWDIMSRFAHFCIMTFSFQHMSPFHG